MAVTSPAIFEADISGQMRLKCYDYSQYQPLCKEGFSDSGDIS
jgi:hypothetical protein